MAKLLSRVQTKVGSALGTIQRTEYEKNVAEGIKMYDLMREQYQKVSSDIKETTPYVGGLSNNEKLEDILKKTANMYGSSQSVSKSFQTLATALHEIGQAERNLFKKLNETCHTNATDFLKTIYPNFKREKGVLDNKLLDMDGAKNKNQKSPSEENKLKEQTATNAYLQQKRTVEGMITEIPNHIKNQAACLKAYTEAMIEYHTTCHDLLSKASHQM